MQLLKMALSLLKHLDEYTQRSRARVCLRLNPLNIKSQRKNLSEKKNVNEKKLFN